MNVTTAEFVHQLIEAWNAHDVDRVITFYADSYEGSDIGEAGSHRGPDGVRAMIGRYLEAFPDLHFTIDTTITQENRVALAWTARGTHLGRVLNIPPTRRSVAIRGVSLLTVDAGKVTSGLYVWDMAGFLRTIGLLPEL